MPCAGSHASVARCPTAPRCRSASPGTSPTSATPSGFDAILGNPPWVRPHARPLAERVALRATYASARDAAWRAGATLAGAGTGFAGQVDLAAPFVERALALLRPGGALALLVPAKLWRSLAGGGLRALLAREARLVALEDWTEAPAAFDAVTYPSLLVATRRPDTVGSVDVAPRPAARSHSQVHVRVHRDAAVAESLVPRDSIPLDADPASPWLLLPSSVRAAFDRLRGAGIPFVERGLARPTLGVKCGCNEAFLVTADLDPASVHDTEHLDATTPIAVESDGRTGHVERGLLRPVVRGEDLARRTVPGDASRWLVWTHDAGGVPLAALPPHAARWLAPWRTRLLARADAGQGDAWWTLFRTPAADARRARVAWADLARAPSPRLLLPGDPHVPLNSCYVAAFDDVRDARAFAALLDAPPMIAWLGALAEPARGGFRRHLAWTLALLPTPRDWTGTRERLARTLDGAPGARTAAVCAAFGLRADELAPLLAWDAGMVPAAALPAPDSAHGPVLAVREGTRRRPLRALTPPLAPTRWRGHPEQGTSCPR